MEEQLIAYFDLLGFSDVIRRADTVALQQILSLLTSLAGAYRDFTRRQENESIVIGPAASAFSDHIVYSYPQDKIHDLALSALLKTLADEAAKVGQPALNAGCLLRGAVTRGQLHHAGRVIFGPALVEAYQMESRLAVYPRIVISDRIGNNFGAQMDSPFIFRDADGVWCLNYIAAFDRMHFINLGFPEVQRSRTDWITSVRDQCDRQEVSLLSDGNFIGLRNWRWFRRKFDQTVAER